MNLKQFLKLLDQSPDDIQFADSSELIERLYRFTATPFINGPLNNSVDENQGSCKIFAFAIDQNLDQQQTLLCFGEHYRAVLKDPDGSEHGNIRQFMKTGWDALSFDDNPVTARQFSASIIGFGKS